MIRRSIRLALAASVMFAGLLQPGVGRAEGPAPASCAAPPALTMIDRPLARMGAAIDKLKSLTIVAVGSSSTEGVGASSLARNYPSRLEAELRQRLPGIELRVVNRGKGGEDVGEELARFDRDVLAEHPELVIWQVGTNAVLRRDDLARDGDMIRKGIARLKDSGADVVLMDMQYAPRVVERPAHAMMEELIADAAEQTRVGLFRRFTLMQYWSAVGRSQVGAAAPAMVGPDGLHMTDAGYGCLASELAESLAWNWASQQRTAARLRAVTATAMEGLHQATATAGQGHAPSGASLKR